MWETNPTDRAFCVSTTDTRNLRRLEVESIRGLDCSTLEEEEHKALAAICALPGKRVVEVTRDYLRDMDVPPDADLELLMDDGFLERAGMRAYIVKHRCNCGYLRAAKKARRVISRSFAESLEQPELTDSEADFSDRLKSGTGSRTTTPVDKKGERTFVRPLISQSLRSRDGNEELTTTSSISSLVGQRVSGRRVSTEVGAKRRRANTTLAWKDRPVERWDARCLAGYFDEQTFLYLHGRSADRYSMKPMLKHFASLRREGITSAECKAMVDLFVQRNLGTDQQITSIWKSFIGQRGRLHRLLTSNASGHYNNQPTTDHGDEGGGWT